jgi:putative ABC transport system substrate-binding protein
MRRRDFITLVGGMAAAWPLVSRAQQPVLPVIGWLHSTSLMEAQARIALFRRGLAEVGIVGGQNATIEIRWAEGHYDRLPALAADLVGRRVAVIVTSGGLPAASAAKAATTTIPIVFTAGVDPVQVGLVASLARPGGNITGVTALTADQVQKRLQLLHDVVPDAKVFGFLLNPDNAGVRSTNGRTTLELAEATVRSWGITIEVARARTVEDFDAAFASLKEKQVQALATQGDPLFDLGRDRLVALAAQHALPTVYHSIEAVQAGGLIGYNASFADSYRQAGLYTGRILRGAKPADLPVLLPTKFELAINMKTAKALGLNVSQDMLSIADEVIE